MKWSFHLFVFFYFSLFWNRNRAWVIHSLSLLVFFLPPKFVFWKYFIVFISYLHYFRTENSDQCLHNKFPNRLPPKFVFSLAFLLQEGNRNNRNRDKSDVSYTVLSFDWMVVFSLNSKRQASFNAFGRRSFAERRSNEMRYWKWSFYLFIFLFFIYFSLFWNRNRAWVIHSYSLLDFFLPPKFVSFRNIS